MSSREDEFSAVVTTVEVVVAIVFGNDVVVAIVVGIDGPPTSNVEARDADESSKLVVAFVVVFVVVLNSGGGVKRSLSFMPPGEACLERRSFDAFSLST